MEMTVTLPAGTYEVRWHETKITIPQTRRDDMTPPNEDVENRGPSHDRTFSAKDAYDLAGGGRGPHPDLVESMNARPPMFDLQPAKCCVMDDSDACRALVWLAANGYLDDIPDNTAATDTLRMAIRIAQEGAIGRCRTHTSYDANINGSVNARVVKRHGVGRLSAIQDQIGDDVCGDI